MEIQELWEKYKIENDLDAKDKLILYYVPVVKVIVARMHSQTYGNFEYDDLYGYGILGLIDSIEKFDIEKNVKFETYANIRVRGAIIDKIRSIDWVPRSIRKKYSLIEDAIYKLQNQYGDSYTNKQLAEELNITEKELLDTLAQISPFAMASLEEKYERNINFDIVSSEDTPEENLDKKELIKLLSKCIEELEEKEKIVINLYYYEELNYKEIAKVLNLSESRVSQLHTKAILKLNTKLSNY